MGLINWLKNLRAKYTRAKKQILWEKLNQQVVQLYHQGKYVEATNLAEQALELAQHI